MQRQGLVLCGIVLFLLQSVLITRFTRTYPQQPTTQRHNTHSPKPGYIFSSDFDDKWLDILRHGKFQSIQSFSSRNSYANKFIVQFEDGDKSVWKLSEADTLIPRGLRATSYNRYEIITSDHW